MFFVKHQQSYLVYKELLLWKVSTFIFWIFKKSVVKCTHVLVFVLVGFQQRKGLFYNSKSWSISLESQQLCPKTICVWEKTQTLFKEKNYVYVFFPMLIEKKYSVQDNWQEVISSNRKKNIRCSKGNLPKNLSIKFFKFFKVFDTCYRSKHFSPRVFRTFFSSSDGVV